jgi:glycosyltransferase involved in cell wall biosynthesis
VLIINIGVSKSNIYMIDFHPVKQADPASMYTVMIPSWNNLGFLKKCVESIEKNSVVPHEIVIHINEGSDGTLEWVKESGISYAHSKENVGICFALNGLRNLIHTPYMVYMNDDMYVLPEWDKHLMDAINNRQDDLFFYSSTMIEPADTGNPCVIAPLDFGTELDQFDEKGLIEASEKQEKENWSGATWPPNIVSTRMWDLVGGYSVELSPGMYSDPDFSKKLWQFGVRDFQGIGKSRVYHFMSKSTLRIKKNNGRSQFLNKWKMSSSTFMKGYLKWGEKVQNLEDVKTKKIEKMLLKDSVKLFLRK